MTGKDLFKGVSYIDEELLGEALDHTAFVRVRKRRSNISQYIAMAASLAIVVLIGSNAYRNGLFNRVPGETPASAASASSFDPASVNDTVTEANEPGESSQSSAPAYIGQNGEGSGTVSAAEPDSTNMGVDLPVGTEGSTDPDSIKYKQMISSYGDKGSSTACYAAPKNGEVGFSIPLRNAMEAMEHDDVLYRVYVDIFEGEQPLSWSDDLINRISPEISAQGPIVAIETVLQDNVPQETAFTLHAAYDQLQSLKAPEGYGLMLFLYDERM